jgi:hypothetical protein
MDDSIAHTKEKVLRDLDLLAERSNDAEVKQRRRELWSQLIPHLGKDDDRDVTQFLAAELQLQPITIRRWLSGEFNPRRAHLQRIGTLLGLSQSRPTDGVVATGEVQDPPVSFDNALAAIRTLNHYFYCLKLAKQAFLFKGKLAYHAGRPGASRDAVISILQERSKLPNPLTMYYFYIEGSEAERTLTSFFASPRVQNSPARNCLKSFAMECGEDKLGLCHSSVSPLILIYDTDGQKEFDRFVDVFFELPVEFVQRDNRPVGDEFSLKTVLIQQPEPEAQKYWEDVVKVVKQLKRNNKTRFGALDDEHLRLPAQYLEVANK